MTVGRFQLSLDMLITNNKEDDVRCKTCIVEVSNFYGLFFTVILSVELSTHVSPFLACLVS